MNIRSGSELVKTHVEKVLCKLREIYFPSCNFLQLLKAFLSC